MLACPPSKRCGSSLFSFGRLVPLLKWTHIPSFASFWQCWQPVPHKLLSYISIPVCACSEHCSAPPALNFLHCECLIVFLSFSSPSWGTLRRLHSQFPLEVILLQSESEMATQVFSKGRSLKRCIWTGKEKSVWLNTLSHLTLFASAVLKWSERKCVSACVLFVWPSLLEHTAFPPSIISLVNFNFLAALSSQTCTLQTCSVGLQPDDLHGAFERCELLADILESGESIWKSEFGASLKNIEGLVPLLHSYITSMAEA